MKYHHEVRIPDFVYPFLFCSFTYESNIVTTISGRDFVKNNCDFPQRIYKISNARFNEKQLAEFLAFYNARMGALCSFRLKDFADFSVIEQPLFSHATQVRNFKLFKLYNDDINPYIRFISLPVLETLSLYTESGALSYRFDEEEQKIILENELIEEQTLFASFQFDVKVRFLTTNIEYSRCKDGSILLTEVTMKEVQDV